MGKGEVIGNDLEVPAWMEKSFFEKILYKADKKEVKVQKVEVSRATRKGDNFSSVLYRVRVTYQSEGLAQNVISFIVKIMPFVKGIKKQVMDGIGSNMFVTEIKMYSEVIPKFEEMLRDLGDKTLIGGKCFYTSMEPEMVLVFEDLSEIGYKTAKWVGVESWDIAWKTIEKLGRWHALSYMEATNSSSGLQKFSKNFWVDELFLTYSLYRDSYKFVLGMLERHSEFAEYIPKFQKIISGDPVRKVQELFKAFPNGNKNIGLYVLNHSDVTIKNLMYKESKDGKVEDVKLIDYQLCIWGPAAIDLILIFYMVLDHDSRIHRRNEIVYHYFSVFTETLKKLNFDGAYPKLTDIYKDLITFKDFEVLLACAFLPVIITMDVQLETEEYIANQNLRRTVYNNPEYIDVMKKLLPFFLHRGYLD